MRKFIQFADGSRRELSPLTFEEFIYLEMWTYVSDTAWGQWKRKNDFVELEDFNEETLAEANWIILEAGEPTILFDPSGQEDWRPFDAWKHDGKSKRRAMGLHWLPKDTA